MRFDLRIFVCKTLTAMRNAGEESYKVMQYALKYYERSVLTDEDMSEIESWFAEAEDDESEGRNETETI